MKKRATHNVWAEIVGWYGMLAILTSFIGISFQVIEPSSLPYIFLSITGATGLLINSFYDKAYPSAALNGIYALVALGALVKHMF